MNSVFNIHGGIHPEEEKHLSNPGTVLDAGLPPSLVLPLSQRKAPLKSGNRVRRGAASVTGIAAITAYW